MPVFVLLPILLLPAWLAVATIVVAACRAASNGDRSMAGGRAPQPADGGRASAAVVRRPHRHLADALCVAEAPGLVAVTSAAPGAPPV